MLVIDEFTVITFGKYKGKRIKDVIWEDPGYLHGMHMRYNSPSNVSKNKLRFDSRLLNQIKESIKNKEEYPWISRRYEKVCKSCGHPTTDSSVKICTKCNKSFID